MDFERPLPFSWLPNSPVGRPSFAIAGRKTPRRRKAQGKSLEGGKAGKRTSLGLWASPEFQFNRRGCWTGNCQYGASHIRTGHHCQSSTSHLAKQTHSMQSQIDISGGYTTLSNPLVFSLQRTAHGQLP